MDQFLGAVAAEAAGGLLTMAVSTLARACTEDPDDAAKLSRVTRPLTDESGNVVAMLDKQQASALTSFLASPHVAEMVGTYALTTVALDSRKDEAAREFVNSSLADDFTSLAQKEIGPVVDSSLFPLVWAHYCDAFDSLLERPRLGRLLSPSEKQLLLQAPVDVLDKNKKTIRVPSFLFELSQILHDFNRIERVDRIQEEIRGAVRSRYSEIRLQHTLDEHRREFDSLYIDRNLVSTDGQSRTTQEVVLSPLRSRIVITGPPAMPLL